MGRGNVTRVGHKIVEESVDVNGGDFLVVDRVSAARCGECTSDGLCSKKEGGDELRVVCAVVVEGDGSHESRAG